MEGTRPGPRPWRPTIAVGYHGGPAAVTAAEWAAAEAHRRGALLRLVQVVREEDRGTAQRWCALEAVRLARRHPRLSTSANALAGNPRSTLAHVARRSSLVVLGATARRRRHAAGELALHLLRTTDTPLVVVPGPAFAPSDGDRRRVVGLVGAASRGAVVEAATVAARVRGAAVSLVEVEPRRTAADDRDPGAAPGADDGVPGTPHAVALAPSARRMPAEAVGAFLAAAALGPADLLVVGRVRDLRTDQLRAGPILRHLLASPPCPLLVVPDEPLWSGTARAGTASSGTASSGTASSGTARSGAGTPTEATPPPDTPLVVPVGG